MNIRVHDPRRQAPQECSVSHFVARALDDGDWTAENTYNSVGRLVELLADRGFLNADDIVDIAGVYCDRAHPPVLLP